MAPLPKRKISKQRKRTRFAAKKLTMGAVVLCKHCNKTKIPHHLCPHCGK